MRPSVWTILILPDFVPSVPLLIGFLNRCTLINKLIFSRFSKDSDFSHERRVVSSSPTASSPLPVEPLSTVGCTNGPFYIWGHGHAYMISAKIFSDPLPLKPCARNNSHSDSKLCLHAFWGTLLSQSRRGRHLWTVHFPSLLRRSSEVSLWKMTAEKAIDSATAIADQIDPSFRAFSYGFLW